jgi:acyl phosphate:glycerol-3-phosphate acyltransferase
LDRKIFFNTDVRNHGSKNAGSTNAIRVLGYKAGLPVLLLDILKGFLAVKMIYLTFYYIPETGDYINFQLLLGLAVIIGHIFPVFANFRGGKGVATLLGVILAIDPISTLICIGVFLFTLIITKYVSLSSMIAGLSFPYPGNCCIQYHYLISGNFLAYYIRAAVIHPSEEY